MFGILGYSIFLHLKIFHHSADPLVLHSIILFNNLRYCILQLAHFAYLTALFSTSCQFKWWNALFQRKKFFLKAFIMCRSHLLIYFCKEKLWFHKFLVLTQRNKEEVFILEPSFNYMSSTHPAHECNSFLIHLETQLKISSDRVIT